MNVQSAAGRARSLLRSAARQLQIADPGSELRDVLETSLPLPPGDPAYRGQRLLEPEFSETAGRSLGLVMSTGGPGASPAERSASAIDAMDRAVGRNFGREAARWLEARVQPARDPGGQATAVGGWFGSSFDSGGLTESRVAIEWGPGLLDALPPTLSEVARLAVQLLPTLRPALSTVRCGRRCGSQQLTFDVDTDLSLNDLKPLMERLGLGKWHAAMMSAVGLVLGARFLLPRDSCTLSVRPRRNGVELQLDVYLDQIPDLPRQLVSLLRLQMNERPRSLRALDRWLLALTPEGWDRPGEFSVLSVRVGPDVPPRLALYLRPVLLDRQSAAPSTGDQPVPAATPAASSAVF
jgi:hypothetical protein